MVKIAQVAAYWGPAYPTGSGVFCYEVSKRLARHFEVHAFTSRIGNFANANNGDGIKLHPLRTYGTVWNMNPVADVFSQLMRQDYDIVHVHSYIFFMSNMAALARLFKRNTRYVLHFHGGLDFTDDLRQAHPGRIWAKERIYDRTLGYFTTRMADSLLSVAKNDIPIVARKFGRTDVTWMPVAVDTDIFSPIGEPPDTPVITFVGKLEAWKGIDTLLKAFRIVHDKVKDVRLVVVGTGSLAGKLAESGLPIEFLGPVPYAEMPDVYRMSSVLVLPSYMEGFPVTCVEALSCRVPVVSTEVGDVAEVVIDGQTGFLARPGDHEYIASRLVDIVSDRDLQMRLGRNGREHVLRNFGYDTIVDMLLKEYEKCLGQKLALPEAVGIAAKKI